MAYNPTAFTPNSILQASLLEGNFNDLRVYLHEGVNVSDFEASKWIQTRHLQPPETLPYQGLTHGVSGFQGGQEGPGFEARLTFCTSFLTGGGLDGINPSS